MTDTRQRATRVATWSTRHHRARATCSTRRHPTRAARRARVAISTLFLVNGAIFAGWVSRVPDVRDRVGAGEAALGLALLGVAVGSMLTMPAVGAACERGDSRRIAAAAALACCASGPLPALAQDVAQLAVALVVVGAAFGALDVAMNVRAIAVEKTYRRPIMSSFHGWFSVGGLAGALGGGLVAGLGVSARAHLAGAALVAVGCVVVASRHLGAADAPARPRGPRRRRVRATRLLVVCGAIAFCAALAEGAMADWSALYMTDVLGAGAGVAALAYAAFCGAMAVGRFGGGPVIGVLGSAGALQVGCSAMALALATGLAAADRSIAIAAFATAGLGVACVFPIVLSMAGSAEDGRSGSAVAFVSTVGYSGFLAGPPLIGAIADRTALSWGLGVVVLLGVLAAALAGALRGAAGPPRRPT
jgi:predicted MFS family arabinose efflux permease